MSQVQPSAWRFLLPLLRPHASTLALALVLLLLQSLAILAQPWLGGMLATRLFSSQGLGALLWILFGLVAAQAAQLLRALHGLQYQFGLHHEAEGVEAEFCGFHGLTPVVQGVLRRQWRVNEL